MARTLTALALLLALSCACAVGVQAQTPTPNQRLATAVAELNRAKAALAALPPRTAAPIIRVIDQALADIALRNPARSPSAVALSLRFQSLTPAVAASIKRATDELRLLTVWPLPPRSPPPPPPPPPRRQTIAEIVTSASASVSQIITALEDTSFSGQAALEGAVTDLSSVLTSLQSSIGNINNAVSSLDLDDEVQAQAELSLRKVLELLTKAR